MRLSLNDKVIVNTTFNDGTVYHWNAGIYSKIKELEIKARALFKETNDFLAWLPPDKLMVVENYYREVQDALAKGNARHTSTDREFVVVVKEISERLTVATGKLFKDITVDLVRQWSSQYKHITIPELPEEHNTVYSEKGTYLKTDYVKLVDLCVALRLLVPVWCEYINIIGDVISSNKHEVSCYGLLRDAEGIIESEAMVKLTEYLEEKSQLEMSKAATAIINGMSRSGISEWILSVTIVRRISISEISSDEDRGNLITSIFGYVQGILNRDLDRKNSGKVRDKFRLNMNMDEGADKQSLIEQYRIKQDITEGDVSTFVTYIMRYPEAAAKDLIIHREMSDEDTALYLMRVNKCIDYAEKINDLGLIPSQEVVLGWIINDIVPYKMLDRVSTKAKRRLIGIAQGYAWHFNLPDIAIALTALHNTEIESSMLVNMPNARVSPNMHQRLSALYAHSHPDMPEAGNEDELKRNNVAVKAVREVIRGFNNGLFQARAPDELWENASSFQKSGIVVFKNISEQIVSLIETLCEV